MALPLTLIPIGGFFENTLGESSLFTAEVQFPGSEEQFNNQNLENVEWLSVMDFGAVGDGTTDDTTAIQETIDTAATLGKKVLIPAGFTFAVKFTHLDPWWDGYWGQCAYCFVLYDNSWVFLEGTIKPIGKSAALTTPAWNASCWAIFQNENAFRFISGSVSAAGNYFPVGWTGDRQGLYEASGCHTGGVSSNVIQLLGSPDLSSVAVEEKIPTIDGLFPAAGTRNIYMAINSSPWFSEVTAVDNTAKTVTVADNFNIALASKKDFTIQNNLYNQNIKITGRGTVDFSSLHNYNPSMTGSPPTNWAGEALWLCRMYRVKDLLIDGITVKGFGIDGFQIGYSERITLSNCTFKEAYDTEAGWASCGNFDVCRYVTVQNCLMYDNPMAVGMFFWATRDIKFLNNTALDLPYSAAGVGGIINTQQGYSMEYFGNGTTDITNLQTMIGVDGDTDVYQIWGMHNFGSLTQDTEGDVVDWNVIVHGNHSIRNSYGMNHLTETFYGGFGKGYIISNNICNSSLWIGIGLSSSVGTIIEGNVLKNNGWGTDPTNEYSATKFNYKTANRGYYD